MRTAEKPNSFFLTYFEIDQTKPSVDVCVARCLRFIVRATVFVEKTVQKLPTTNTSRLRKT